MNISNEIFAYFQEFRDGTISPMRLNYYNTLVRAGRLLEYSTCPGCTSKIGILENTDTHTAYFTCTNCGRELAVDTKLHPGDEAYFAAAYLMGQQPPVTVQSLKKVVTINERQQSDLYRDHKFLTFQEDWMRWNEANRKYPDLSPIFEMVEVDGWHYHSAEKECGDMYYLVWTIEYVA